MNPKLTKKLFFCWILIESLTASSQIPVGAWRDHLPYSHATKLAYGDNKVFCITNGGMFYYNLADNSVNRLSKIQGLSDIGFSSIAYDSTNSTLIIGYSNGNIDLIQDRVYNIPDLEQKQMAGDKTINEIRCLDELVYLSCGFGIIVLDVIKREIKDTYRIGEGGKEIKVNSVIIQGQYLYAATDEGLYKADKSANLLDSRSWERILDIPEATGKFKDITVFNGKVYAASGSGVVYANESISWVAVINESDIFHNMTSYQDRLIITCERSIKVYSAQHLIMQSIPTERGRHAIWIEPAYWIASFNKGLIKIDADHFEESIYPNGPWFAAAYDIEIADNEVWVAGGSFPTKDNGYGAYYFNEVTGWENINYLTQPALTSIYNLAIIAINPSDHDIIYAGSYGYGLVEITNYEVSAIPYDETNSPLQNVTGFDHGYINITGMSYDNGNNLWILTTIVSDPLYVLKSDGTWHHFDLDYPTLGKNQKVDKLIITRDGYKCFLLTGGNTPCVYGLFVVDDQGQLNDSKLRTKYIAVKNQEDIAVDHVFSIKEDLEGNIWVGTNNGPIVYYNFANIFEEDNPLGNQIIIPRNDGTIYGDALLGASSITAIEIDGANRKWFGTINSGLFLISADGMKQIHSFNTLNSPIFSDRINDIALNQQTGELFVATEKGLISFRSDATMADDEFKDVYIFPNPVRENYSGDIIITGLAKNANVKITDISGNIVYETTALGGQALWDGNNFQSKRVHTGVYLVFCTNEDASKTHITKLLLIN